MAIQSTSELEAVLSRVALSLEKHITQRGTWPALEETKRTWEHARAAARQAPKLKAMREKLRTASEVVAAELPNEGALHEDSWDIEDFVDYRL